MSVFTSTLNQMLLMFLFIVLGFFLKKKSILPQNGNTVMSKLENMVFMPCLVLNTFISRCTVENIVDKWNYILLSIGSLLIATVLSLILTRFFAKTEEEKGIYRYSFIIANIAFMGNAMVGGIFGDDVLFDYLIFTLPLNIFLNSIGISWLIPEKEGGSYWKKLFNPINIATFAGIILGLTGCQLPGVVTNFISSASACMSPVAMILTGFVIGGYEIRKLLLIKRVYLLSIYRLVLMPLLFFGISRLLRLPEDLHIVLLCVYAMPLGLNTIVIPAAYDGDTTQGASMALISNLLALVTIPVMFSILL